MKKYKIYAENVEEKAMAQFHEAMAQSFVVRGALMPDAHTGYTLPIGSVVACEDAVVPAYVGYDIGCGMGAVRTTFKKSDIIEWRESIFKQIYRDIPVGFNSHKGEQKDWSRFLRSISQSDWLSKNYLDKHIQQLGTLGGGNHFIEIGSDEQDNIWIIVHSGSRNLGHNVASRYMALAANSEKPEEGHFPLMYGDKEFDNYITDMNFCLEYALENRRRMLTSAYEAIERYCKPKGDGVQWINRNHNHAEMNVDGLWVHRKGATHAEEGMMGVIPGNMRDGSFIVRGKGNEDAMCSSSHGAGRVMGRYKAKKKLKVEDFVETMSGITAKVGKDTLDESPAAYKDIFEVMRLQEDLVEVVAHVKPIINIKG
jgi:tRNA-splicing ligase RtcB